MRAVKECSSLKCTAASGIVFYLSPDADDRIVSPIPLLSIWLYLLLVCVCFQKHMAIFSRAGCVVFTNTIFYCSFVTLGKTFKEARQLGKVQRGLGGSDYFIEEVISKLTL